ncbi:glycosyltransferase [uncultured Pedobacter sp.]|uniref:glycosyltransferase n=1 Tax=uncultured Pedobacter sp. TaxID=246139 RepID=UPI0025F2AB49|nr:glycosyltransferase [uncultured Pedobacter sp.]
MEIAFYVHHHGSGHLMRCLAIASALKNCHITFLGSGLAPYKSIIPGTIELIYLPMDTPTDEDHYFLNRSLEGLHYAPLNVGGQLQRVNIMTGFLSSRPKLLFVVDVSAEMAMLSRLCGVPTIVVRQHGLRDDLPHQICYRNAIGLLAPFDVRMSGRVPTWIHEKTFYTGGLSRFAPSADLSDAAKRHVAVLIGSGGTSIDHHFLNHLAWQCTEWTFHIVGNGQHAQNINNLYFHGKLEDPRAILADCCIVIGNAGHNTVMECASLNKRFIAIAEERPFKEQEEKAVIIDELKLATHLPASAIFHTDWKEMLENLLTSRPNWTGFIRSDAAERAADYLMNTHRSVFQHH